MTDLKQDLLTYWRAGFPGLYVVSSEETRVEQLLLWAVEQRKGEAWAKATPPKIYLWTITNGWTDMLAERQPEVKIAGVSDTRDPQGALDAAFKFPQHTIALLKDFHPWMDDPVALRKIKDLATLYKGSWGRLLVFCSPRLPHAGLRENYALPPEVARELTLVEVPLPTREELGLVLDDIVGTPQNKMTAPTADERDALLEAGAGMTTQEAENAFALAWLRHGTFGAPAVRTIYECKTQAVRRSGALECILDSGEGLDDVGGFDVYKQFVVRKAGAFTKKAKDFGLRKPKGVLLLGAPGTGKSLCAKATATFLKLPLLRADIGALYGSFVGDSERNTREMLRTAEAMAPVVLWVDEIDKTMGSATAAGLTSDVTQRVIGTILTWRQETTAPVFMVATANRLDKLDPALMRAGRFDAVFWVDLPTAAEREQIVRIHLRKKRRDGLPWVSGEADEKTRRGLSKAGLAEAEKAVRAAAHETMAEIVAASEGFSGAEIAEAVEEALLEAFYAGRDLLAQDLKLAMRRIKPLSVTAEKELAAMREWLEGKCRPVSSEAAPVAVEPGKRRRSVEQ